MKLYKQIKLKNEQMAKKAEADKKEREVMENSKGRARKSTFSLKTLKATVAPLKIMMDDGE